MTIQKVTWKELDSLTELFDLYRIFFNSRRTEKGKGVFETEINK
ncbi:hypothetical protein [Alteribacillus bidgolensis]|uniref:Uncharacterized protein n=1 Tax=Alteribacillus bidgolensis TaxID=930129 RepID=A0A1G8MF17_9BACI|nr:hypothetical protein [Alteribacillus bidgolensis]SDI66559.1 hypothetical protein SAMN05216352_11019 [Alteribacillus bidgolensis]